MSVTAARGFVAGGVHCGIRRAAPDLAIVRSVEPAVGAALFTVNRVLAAPCAVSQLNLGQAEPQAVVLNSGVANAATGERGKLDALATCAEAGRLLGLRAEEVLVCSTGVIGKRLPMINLTSGLKELVPTLSADGGDAAAHAIMTTDTVAKQSAVQCDGFAVGGMAKGAGMIHPVLATMLAVLTTDYPLTREEADAILRPAVDATFNRISVDGDCSTNDAVILLANGASGVERTPARDAELAAAVRTVCGELAEMIVRDGEGATVLLQIDVSGAATEAEATAIAQRIAISPLVKTAAFGHDPNWGRVLAAAGSAPWGDGFARLEPERVTLAFNGTPVFVDGAPVDATPDLAGTLCRIELSLGLGDGTASYIASDLTYDYVRINAEYTT